MLRLLAVGKVACAPGWQRTLVKGASGALAVQIGGAALGFLVHVVLARLLGQAEYGLYALALTWVTFLLIPALLGQSTGVLRFAPAYIQRREWDRLRGLARHSNLAVFAAAAGLAFCGASVMWLLRSRFGSELTRTFYVAFLVLPIVALLQLNGAFHQALKRPVSAGAFNTILRPAALLLIVALAVGLFGVPATAPLAMAASGAGALLALAACVLLLRTAWPGEAARAGTAWPGEAARAGIACESREWLRIGRRLLFVDGIGLVLNRIDVILLGSIQGTANLGAYYAAVQIAAVGSFGLNAVNTILAPMIAERYAAGDHEGLAAVTADAARLILAFSGVVLLGGILFGRAVLAMFGASFEAAYVPLLVILGGQFLNAACGPVGFLMSMTRHEGALLKVFGVGAALNVALSAILIRSHGMMGAAIASAVATIVWNVAALFFVRRKLGINPSALAFLSP